MICGLTLKAHDFPGSQDSFHSVHGTTAYQPLSNPGVQEAASMELPQVAVGAGVWGVFLSYIFPVSCSLSYTAQIQGALTKIQIPGLETEYF